MVKNKTKTLKDLTLMVEKEFKGYKSKDEIVNDVISEDLDTLLNLVRDNPDAYAVCIRSITARTKNIIKNMVNNRDRYKNVSN
jgi:hypothetical protein